MNKYIKNIITMFFGMGLNVILGVITVPMITRIVEPSQYGEFSLLQTYIIIISTLSMLGLDQAYVRFFYAENSIEYKNTLTKKVVFFPVILSILYCIFFMVLIRKILNIRIDTSVLFSLGVLIVVIENFTRLSVRFNKNAKQYSILLIIQRIVFALSALLLLKITKIYSVNALIVATNTSLVIAVIIAIFFEKKLWLNFKLYKKSKVKLKSLLMYSYPFIFSSVVGWLLNSIDRISINHFSTFSEVGFYSAAASIVSIVTILQTTFTTIWVPIAIEKFEKNENDYTFYSNSFDYSVIIMFFIGSTLILFKDAISYILGGNYSIAKYIFPTLLMQPILFTLSEVTVYGINFYKKTYWHIIISIVSCVVNLFINYKLVPIYGGRGAAISTGISYIIFFIARTYASKMYFDVKYNLRKMFIILALFFVFALYNTFNNFNKTSLMLYIVVISLVLILYKSKISYLHKFINDNISVFLKKEKR